MDLVINTADDMIKQTNGNLEKDEVEKKDENKNDNKENEIIEK